MKRSAVSAPRSRDLQDTSRKGQGWVEWKGLSWRESNGITDGGGDESENVNLFSSPRMHMTMEVIGGSTQRPGVKEDGENSSGGCRGRTVVGSGT